MSRQKPAHPRRDRAGCTSLVHEAAVLNEVAAADRELMLTTGRDALALAGRELGCDGARFVEVLAAVDVDVDGADLAGVLDRLGVTTPDDLRRVLQTVAVTCTVSTAVWAADRTCTELTVDDLLTVMRQLGPVG